MGQERLTSLALICMTVERVAKLEARVKEFGSSGRRRLLLNFLITPRYR